MNVASDGCSRASRTDYLRPGPASAEEGSQVLVGASTMDVRYPLRVPLPSRRQLDQVYFVALDAQQSRGAASVIHQIALQQTDNSTLLSTAAKPRMSVSRCSLQAMCAQLIGVFRVPSSRHRGGLRLWTRHAARVNRGAPACRRVNDLSYGRFESNGQCTRATQVRIILRLA